MYPASAQCTTKMQAGVLPAKAEPGIARHRPPALLPAGKEVFTAPPPKAAGRISRQGSPALLLRASAILPEVWKKSMLPQKAARQGVPAEGPPQSGENAGQLCFFLRYRC